MKVVIRLDSHISFNYVKLKRNDKQCCEELREELFHSNPVYYRNERMGIPNGKMVKGVYVEKEPEYYKAYKLKNGRMKINRGCLKKVRKILKSNGHSIKIKDNRVSGTKVNYKRNKTILRAEQKPAVKKSLKKHQGIVRGPCASGKSVIGLEIIAKAKVRGMIVVWSKTHQQQWFDEAQNHELLNLKKKDIGGVGGIFSKRKLGKINVCMQQSLWNKDHRKFFFPECGALIADEVQRFAASTFNKVVNESPAKIRIGLSANERRKDQKEFLIYNAFGKVIHIIPDSGIGSRKKAKIYLIPTKYTNDIYEDNKRTPELYNDMARNKARNSIIIKRAVQKTARKKLVLILVERKFLALYLYEKLSEKNLKCMLMVGKTTKKEILKADDWKKSWKKRMLSYNDDKEFFKIKKLGTQKKIDVIIATQKGDVGLNIKTIDHLIITTPTGGNIERFNQQKGRPERDYDKKLIKKFGKKRTPTVDYLWDVKIESLRKKGTTILNSFDNVNVLTKRKVKNDKGKKRKKRKKS